MNLVFVTGFTPAVENIRGVSAHPYFLLKHRPDDVNVLMLTYNINKMPLEYIEDLKNDLNLEIKLISLPTYIHFLTNKFVIPFLKRPEFSYIRPSKEVISLISEFQPNAIWTYPNFFFKWSYYFPNINFVHSSPDSNVLGCVRRFEDSINRDNCLLSIYRRLQYQKAINNERLSAANNSLIHLVGMDDLRMFRRTSKSNNSFFILHPHYLLMDKNITFGHEKLNVVIAGKYDEYMKSGVDDFVEVLKSNTLCSMLSITFLGRNWDYIVTNLKEAGYDCKQVKWVDNYIEELVKYDIQLTPITIGTGTKGKVLDAIGNGLLCIGTPYALENIAVRNMDSCIMYKDAHELVGIFTSIYYHRSKYEAIAMKGMAQIRMYHNPSRISHRFFNIIKNYYEG